MEKGLIIKSTGSWYTIKKEDGTTIEGKIRGKFRIKGIKTTNPVAVGDWVEYKIYEKTAIIFNIRDRKNYIIRKSSNLSKYSNIIAANIDQAFLVITIFYPKTLTGFIDRYLVSAEAYNIPVHLVFNKIDLYNGKLLEQLKNLKTIYEKIGYNCLETSALKHINIESLRKLMKGKINVISGISGVGKSRLINSLDQNLNLKIGEISKFHQKGMHITTYTEMFELSTGGYVIDTPGVKGFGVFVMKNEEISHHFPEIFKLSRNCRYYNCTHVHAPDCAVQEGLKNGIISESRYKSYLSLLSDNNDKYR